MRLIDADAFAAQLQREAKAIRKMHPDRIGKIMSETCIAIAEAIIMSEGSPAEELEPVRLGKYNEKDECTVCGFPRPTDDSRDVIFKSEIKFCYNCGAKMDGGVSDA